MISKKTVPSSTHFQSQRESLQTKFGDRSNHPFQYQMSYSKRMETWGLRLPFYYKELNKGLKGSLNKHLGQIIPTNTYLSPIKQELGMMLIALQIFIPSSFLLQGTRNYPLFSPAQVFGPLQFTAKTTTAFRKAAFHHRFSAAIEICNFAIDLADQFQLWYVDLERGLRRYR